MIKSFLCALLLFPLVAIIVIHLHNKNVSARYVFIMKFLLKSTDDFDYYIRMIKVWENYFSTDNLIDYENGYYIMNHCS